MENVTGTRLKLLREEKGLSKAEVARRLNLNTYNTVSSWENNVNYPRAAEIIKLCEMYEVSADFILGLSNDR